MEWDAVHTEERKHVFLRHNFFYLYKMDPIPQWSCDRVHVGVAALLTKKINGETFVLLGRRIASHGAFTLQLPGRCVTT